MRDVFCIDQFDNLLIRPSGKDNVIIGPCCLTQGVKTNPRQFDFATNPYLMEIRQATTNNQRAAACEQCWNQEDSGGRSRRMMGERDDPALYQGVVLKKIDYTTQNLCNLACVHCNPGSSSLWAKIINQDLDQQKESYQDKVSMLQSMDLSTIEHFHITGGEPLMSKEHVRLLEAVDKFDRLDKITVSYNTNGTFMPDQQVLNLWQKPRRLYLMCSVDAIGAAAELLRWPCQWSIVDGFVRKMVDLAKTTCPISK